MTSGALVTCVLFSRFGLLLVFYHLVSFYSASIIPHISLSCIYLWIQRFSHCPKIFWMLNERGFICLTWYSYSLKLTKFYCCMLLALWGLSWSDENTFVSAADLLVTDQDPHLPKEELMTNSELSAIVVGAGSLYPLFPSVISTSSKDYCAVFWIGPVKLCAYVRDFSLYSIVIWLLSCVL